MDRSSAALSKPPLRILDSAFQVFRYERLGLLLLWLPPLAFLGVFYFYPLFSILRVETQDFASQPGAAGGNGWHWLAAPFIEALTSPATRQVIGFTFTQAALSTLLTLAFGLPGAYLLARFQFPGKSLILAMTSIAFVLPTLVVAAAFNAVVGPRGWVNLALMQILGLPHPPIQFINTLWAILVVHVFYNITIVLRVVGDFWSHLDPRIAQAAQTLGANRWQTLRRVTLPLLMPAISAAALLVFIFDFTSFGVVLVLGRPRYATLEVEIYQQTIGLFNLPLAAALAALQLFFTLGLTILYTRLSARLSRPLTLRPRQYTQRRLIGPERGKLAQVAAIAYLALLLGMLTLPLVALVLRSFIQIEALPSASGGLILHPTLDYYRELSINRRDSLFYAPPTQAIAISLAYAAATVVLSLALGLPAAWALARPDEGLPPMIARINHWIDPILMLPLGTSALTLGLGFIVALDRPPLDLRASPLLIPLAHTLVAFPFVVRSLTPALRSIRPRLRQAAAVLCASPLQVFRRIDLPLVGRAVLVAAAFAFTISIGEFGATALIARPEYPTIPVIIYRFLSQPGALNYGQALALSVILALTTAATVLAIEHFRIAEIGEF